MGIQKQKREKKNEGCKLSLNPSEDKGTAAAVVVVLLSELDRISFNSQKTYARV